MSARNVIQIFMEDHSASFARGRSNAVTGGRLAFFKKEIT